MVVLPVDGVRVAWLFAVCIDGSAKHMLCSQSIHEYACTRLIWVCYPYGPYPMLSLTNAHYQNIFYSVVSGMMLFWFCCSIAFMVLPL
jgi:hypothetical protein